MPFTTTATPQRSAKTRVIARDTCPNPAGFGAASGADWAGSHRFSTREEGGIGVADRPSARLDSAHAASHWAVGVDVFCHRVDPDGPAATAISGDVQNA